MKRPPKVNKRQAIILAAVTCFSKKGVADTTMAEVAATAKVDPPLIHYYFPSKESLFYDVVGYALQSAKDANLAPFERNLDPVELLSEYIRAIFVWAEREPGLFSLFLYFYYLSSYPGRFRDLNSDMRRVGRERIATLIYEGVETGDFTIPKKQNVQEVASFIQGLMTGNCVLAGTENKPPRSLADLTVRTALQILGVTKKA